MLSTTDIVNMYKNSVPVQEIANKDGRAVGTIYRILNKNNTVIKDNRILDVDAIVELHITGMTSREIANKLNMVDSSVRRVLKRMNLNRKVRDYMDINPLDIDKAVYNYTELKMSIKNSCKDFNFSESVLRSELKLRGINTRGYSETNCRNSTNKCKRGLKGSIIVDNKPISFDSFYELLFIVKMLKDPNIISIKRCEDVIPYNLDGKNRHYNPDFIIHYKDSNCVIEVKPLLRVNETEVIAKQKVATNLYDCYKIVTENELLLYSKKTFNEYTIDVKENLDKYINRYKNKIKNEL